MGNIQYTLIIAHTLVMVRLAGRKGVNYNFSGGTAKVLCVMKELELAFRLDFLFLFDQAKRKLKDKTSIKHLLNK